MNIYNRYVFTAIFNLKKCQRNMQAGTMASQQMCFPVFMLARNDRLQAHHVRRAESRVASALETPSLIRPSQSFSTGPAYLALCRSAPGRRGSLSAASVPSSDQQRSTSGSVNAEGETMVSAGSSSSEQSNYSFADETVQKVQGTCLHKLPIHPGEVHVWWLFPDEVRTAPLVAATCVPFCPLE